MIARGNDSFRGASMTGTGRSESVEGTSSPNQIRGICTEFDFHKLAIKRDAIIWAMRQRRQCSAMAITFLIVIVRQRT